MGTTGTAIIPFNASASGNPFGTVKFFAPKNTTGGDTTVAVDLSRPLLYVGETVAITGSNPGGVRVFTIGTNTTPLTEITGSPYASGGALGYTVPAMTSVNDSDACVTIVTYTSAFPRRRPAVGEAIPLRTSRYLTTRATLAAPVYVMSGERMGGRDPAAGGADEQRRAGFSGCSCGFTAASPGARSVEVRVGGVERGQAMTGVDAADARPAPRIRRQDRARIGVGRRQSRHGQGRRAAGRRLCRTTVARHACRGRGAGRAVVRTDREGDP